VQWIGLKGKRHVQILDDWEDQIQCEKSFFQKAYQIKEHDIPASLYVNFRPDMCTWGQDDMDGEREQAGDIGWKRGDAFTWHLQ
jgi:hypothetical protein